MTRIRGDRVPVTVVTVLKMRRDSVMWCYPVDENVSVTLTVVELLFNRPRPIRYCTVGTSLRHVPDQILAVRMISSESSISCSGYSAFRNAVQE